MFSSHFVLHWPEIRLPCFFFQAEDGIRDYKVTGVQTCALPISSSAPARIAAAERHRAAADVPVEQRREEVRKIGRASCREREEIAGSEGDIEKKGTEKSGGREWRDGKREER